MNEYQYLDTLSNVIKNGNERQTRNAMTRSIFFSKFVFDLSDGTLPLLTTKKVSLRNVFYELMWFLSGSNDTKELSDKGVKIWNANSSASFLKSRNLDYPEGELGPMYGHQFRNFGAKYNDNGFDQILSIQNLIKNDPTSRRIVMSVWAAHQLDEMALAPCHGTVIQFYVNGTHLDCYTHQRSCDLYLGCPYNIASYSLLVHLFAKTCNLVPGKLIYTFGDVHLYENQIEAASIQAKRIPKEFPCVTIKTKHENVWEYKFEDIELIGYNPETKKLPIVKMIP
jgi:thymidylate synthase